MIESAHERLCLSFFGSAGNPRCGHDQTMLTEVYIDVLVVDEGSADQMWVAWSKVGSCRTAEQIPGLISIPVEYTGMVIIAVLDLNLIKGKNNLHQQKAHIELHIFYPSPSTFQS